MVEVAFTEQRVGHGRLPRSDSGVQRRQRRRAGIWTTGARSSAPTAANTSFSVLLFEYDVESGDESTDPPGDSREQLQRCRSGASIKDGSNNDADLGHDEFTSSYLQG